MAIVSERRSLERPRKQARFAGRLSASGVALFLLVGAAGVAAPARAEATAVSKQTCSDNYVKAQELKEAGQLFQARIALRICGQEACPLVFSKDCIQWLQEVEGRIPTVVVDAKADDNDPIDVRVEVDGRLAAEKLDGKAIEVEPGRHSFRFTWSGRTKTREVVVPESVHGYQVTADFREVPAAATAPGGARATTAPQGPPMHRPVPTSVFVLGGVAVAAAITSGAFRLRADSQVSTLEQSGCSPFCDVKSVDQSVVITNVALGVSAASLAAAALLYFTRPSVRADGEKPVVTDARAARTQQPRETASVTMHPFGAPFAGGALAGVGGAF